MSPPATKTVTWPDTFMLQFRSRRGGDPVAILDKPVL
jgi:hypothetical protein